MLRMLCNEKRALGARNRNIENMLLAFIKIDEIVIPLSEIISTSSKNSLIHIKRYFVLLTDFINLEI